MTHEFIRILAAHKLASRQNSRTVLATIVHVEGSSYRKVGTQMLIDESFNTTGVLSGGCVEKEVVRQSLSVFSTTLPRMVKYDGRYRLGCNGTLYILLEIFNPNAESLGEIERLIEGRESFSIKSTYSKLEISDPRLGTVFQPAKPDHQNAPIQEGLLEFENTFTSLRRLFVFGAEHDAGKLSQIASFLGWEVIVIASLDCDSEISRFPGARQLYKMQRENIDLDMLCNNSAAILMSHNYSKDLGVLTRIIGSDLRYIGLLGPASRKERLLNDLISMDDEASDYSFEKIHGPVGLNIASITPEEIALSIMAELTGIFN